MTFTVLGPTVPGAPTLHAPTVNGSTVTLSWSPGSGGTPTSYALAASLTAGGAPIATFPLVGATVSIANVPQGTYYVRLTAINAAGASPLSAEVTVSVP